MTLPRIDLPIGTSIGTRPAAAPGVALAPHPVLLKSHAPPARTRFGHRGSGQRTGGTAHVAVNAIAIAIGGLLSGLLAGAIAAQLQGWSWVLPGLGIVLTYHGVLFVISSALRTAALLFALKLEEPAAAGTRDAFRYVSGSIYGNVRQAVLLPTRIVGRAARISYRITRTPVPRR
jgi:hypothetical protein